MAWRVALVHLNERECNCYTYEYDCQLCIECIYVLAISIATRRTHWYTRELIIRFSSGVILQRRYNESATIQAKNSVGFPTISIKLNEFIC